ncbi:MAG: hypothetical protein QM786_08675 [Breznakibacter sp.]
MDVNISLVLLLLVPILVISVVALSMVRWFTKSFDMQIRALTNHEQRKQLVSLRTQAYERLTIYVERIQPQSIVVREQQLSMTSQQFHSHLLKTIRNEFEHNLAMQIYMSGDVWLSIIQARDEMIKLVNTCATQTNPAHPSMVLGQAIIEQSGNVSYAFKKAIDAIKADMAKM